MPDKIKAVFLDIVGDFKSSIIHAHDLLIHSSTKSVIIFFSISLILFFAVVFNSNNQAGFYINFLRILLVSSATYFVFCLSNYFWFLMKRRGYYKTIINHKKKISEFLEAIREKDEALDENANFEEIISYTAKLNSIEYKYHAKRYAIESFIIIFLLGYIDSNFLILNILLFGGMSIYVLLYEPLAYDQGFDDIRMLVYCTDRFSKKHPKKCKKFIMESKLKEIKELKVIYKAVLETK